MMKIKIIILLTYSLSYFNSNAQNQVSFFEEYIDFSIDKQHFTINGIYSFCNYSDREINQPILFPFADDVLEIDSIRVVNLKTSSNVAFTKSGKYISFVLKIMPKDTVDLNIYYRQKTVSSNKYIITSTKAWGKPLEKAFYSLTVDKGINIKSFSYQPDSFKKKKRIYFWKKDNFMPDEDFIVTIQK